MTRNFLHSFEPTTASPVTGPTVDLDVSGIEDAGIREVLQTPGAAYGAWSILDALLTPTGTGTPFIFREPLGQAREVKVALSGLFGRFVARAYLERYFTLQSFDLRPPWQPDYRSGSPKAGQDQTPFPRRPARLDRMRFQSFVPNSGRSERLP